jgi:hypothetical protein
MSGRSHSAAMLADIEGFTGAGSFELAAADGHRRYADGAGSASGRLRMRRPAVGR